MQLRGVAGGYAGWIGFKAGGESTTARHSGTVLGPARDEQYAQARPHRVGGGLLVNPSKAEVADRLTKAGQPPKGLTAGAGCGAEKATELFEAAYDEHAHRIAKYYQNLGA